jgi:hypothetical protein
MMIIEVLLALLVGAGALSLILYPLFRPTAGLAAAGWDLPDLEETRKGQALLALKEIEFDLATGKLSEGDFADLKRKFTTEAVAAMREEGPPGPSPAGGKGTRGEVACPSCGPRPESDAIFCSTCGNLLSTLTCAGCGAAMAPGAKFCEGCGRPAAQ